ncbi:unnamed protein product [Oppiella nova]|uniref:Protein kinase domain-containing protein n=1 Tax=Oppiella nova TaxID=334625 RepID=A0A7R9LY01_9ACAR|nr:unnamed protein product [Oppiella nova]CAG2168095.1 unnamed protein product [Oppiella nova]
MSEDVSQPLPLICRLNGQTSAPSVVRHGSRRDTTATQNMYKVVAIEGYGTDNDKIDLYYRLGQFIGKGAFGSVFIGVLPQFNDRTVAVKQVLQDKRYRNRELPLMRSLRHQNVVTLLYFFLQEVKDHSNQMLRALAYIHSKGICHRDIKPNNLLFDANSGVLKVCDFGSAKPLVKGQTNVSYICARYYRAPELLFGATDYTNMIDIWSVGVVFTELLLGKPLFHGQSCIDQLVLIISKLGTPTKDQIQELNHNYVKYDLPQIKPRPLQSLFPPKTPSEAIDLMLKIFEYKPSLRIGALHACAHSLFDELREPGKKWAPDPFAKPRDLPPLFDFTEHELSIEPSLNSILVPNHYQRLIGDGSATAPHI